MKETMLHTGVWWARGLLFENCNCTAVCPGHVHFDQDCTHERCVGYWAIRFDGGSFDGVELAGIRVLIAYDSPMRMIEGGWTQSLVIDESADERQRAAVTAIIEGRAGGPWAKLAPFVGQRVETRYLPIEIEDEVSAKRVGVVGLVRSVVAAIRGRDRTQPVTFQNMFNQIHAPTQVVAKGDTRYDDGTIVVDTKGTHALWSSFEWRHEPGS